MENFILIREYNWTDLTWNELVNNLLDKSLCSAVCTRLLAVLNFTAETMPTQNISFEITIFDWLQDSLVDTHGRDRLNVCDTLLTQLLAQKKSRKESDRKT